MDSEATGTPAQDSAAAAEPAIGTSDLAGPWPAELEEVARANSAALAGG